MLGKCRWVEDNQVVLVAHAVQVFECILGVGCVAGIAGEVEFHVFVGQVDDFAELSTECTRRAPPRMAYTENPPV